MNLINFYRYLPYVPFAINGCIESYHSIRYSFLPWAFPSYFPSPPKTPDFLNKATVTGVDGEKTEEVAKNTDTIHRLQTLTKTPLSELSFAMKSKVRPSLPYFHHGHFGLKNKKDFEILRENFSSTISYMTGVGAACIPISQFFQKCLEERSGPVCIQTAASDLMTLSAFQLILGAYIISKVANTLFWNPVINTCSRDSFINSALRYFILLSEFKMMGNALTEKWNTPEGTEKEEAPTQEADKKKEKPKPISRAELIEIAKDFLKLQPYIEKELIASCAIDEKDVKEIVMPLTTACYHVLLNQVEDSL